MDTQAKLITSEGMKLMDEVCATSNELELLVDDTKWSLPKYRELIYIQ